MNTLRNIFFTCLGFAFIIAACSPKDSAPTESLGHNLLYALTFDNEAAFFGWHVGAPGQYDWLKNTQDGKYLFEYPSGFLESQDFNFGNAQINVEVEFLVQTRVEISLACRMQPDASGRYGFNIANDGRWSIRNGESILAEGWSDQIKIDKNRLSARCVGDQLTLLVNNVELGSARDGAFTSGSLNFGYAAETAGAGTFDNITVEDWGEGKTPQADSAPQGESAPTQVAALEPATPTPAPVSTATLRPTSIPEGELTLYQTEFDDGDPSLTDWKTFAYSMDKKDFVTEGYEVFAKNGAYHFRQGANNRTFVIYNKDLGTADVDISASGTAPFEGHGGLGLVCRYSEAGWYQFMVESYGVWSVRLVKPDESGQFRFHVISSATTPKWIEKDADLRVECKGDRLTFYIEGEKMASLHDTTFPTGKVGFLGWSFALPDDWNAMNHFSVRRAQWNETNLLGPAPTPAAERIIYSTDFARLDDLNPYWERTDLGVIGIPGSPILFGGPGGEVSPHTYLYINDFDPAADVEISADIHPVYLFRRGLVCRYSEDGWYEAFHLSDGKDNPVILVRKQRDEQGKFTGADTILGVVYVGSQSQVNLTLTCIGNQISVKLNGEQILSAEDNTWTSGRYGFLFIDNPYGNPRSAMLNYAVRTADAPKMPKVGDVIYEETFDTPEEIASTFNLDLMDTERLKIQDNALSLTPRNNALHPFSNDKFADSEFILEAEFLSSGALNLHCRNESASLIGAEINRDGGWNLVLNYEKIQANGHSSAIQNGQNQLTLSCVGPRITFKVNGETLASVELPDYSTVQGAVGWDVYEGSEVKITKVALTVFQSQMPPPILNPLLNQVSIPTYLPGETIFDWDMTNFTNGCGDGWWGRDANPCLWKKTYNPFVIGKHITGNSISVTENTKSLTLFTYQPDLYDLPIEISADVTLASKGGAVALFCRATAIGQYEFYIQPDGRWYIRRDVLGDNGLPNAKYLTILAQGTVENFSPENMQMSATCNESNLILSLNGAEIGRTQDTLYPEGQAGIFFDVFSEGSFTNLNLRRAK